MTASVPPDAPRRVLLVDDEVALLRVTARVLARDGFHITCARSGQEARLVVPNAKPGDIMRLPEGSYRVVSTYLEKESAGSTPAPGAAANSTNSVVKAELRVQS